MHSQHVHPEHPPDEEYRDDGSRDVNDPVARCFRFSKIEHAAMVAGPAQAAYLRDSTHMHSCHAPEPVNLEYWRAAHRSRSDKNRWTRCADRTDRDL